ncbi:MAG TPA: hypothetical protein VFK02_17595 [Kofleriaceae bacterium]|nr:hypothetical protein [Kofleriaceae bacterium]
MQWAAEFKDIPETLAARPDLRAAMHLLLEARPLPVKVTEGADRDARRRAILGKVIDGALSLDEAIAETERRLVRDGSPHAANNRVFATGWARRLIYTHISVLYTWAVLEALLAAGQPRCFVAHSSAEAATSTCSQLVAGKLHDAAAMRDRLVAAYVTGRPPRAPFVPSHPHCTHVASPPPERAEPR